MRYIALLLSLLGCSAVSEETATPECLNDIGHTACDFMLIDQNNEEFHLYDHQGKVIVLDFSAQWCAPCQYAANFVQGTQDAYPDDLVYVTVIAEDLYGLDPKLSDIKLWAEVFEIEAPVLKGGDFILNRDPTESWYLTNWPTFYFIDRESTIRSSMFGFSDDIINQEIQELL